MAVTVIAKIFFFILHLTCMDPLGGGGNRGSGPP